MDPDIRWLQPIQRTQRTLAMGVHTLDPDEVLARETWRLAAEHLTRRWFPRSQNLAIGELIRQSYLHALWWYPILQQRCLGTCLPTWHTGTVLTWFRRAASRATGQWFFASGSIETEAAPEAAFQEAAALPGVGNQAWVEASLGLLAQLAATGSRKSVIPRYILESLAFRDTDREFDAQFECRAPARRRRILRVNKQGTSSYLRCGRTAYLLADEHLAARADDVAWVDLREAAVPFGDCLIGARKDDKAANYRLEIWLQERVIKEARNEIKAIATGRGPAPSRLHALRRFLCAFEAQHRYAPGAWRQLNEISKYAKGQSKRHIKPQLGPDQDKSLPAIRTTNTLIIPRPNPFLESASLEEWERWFSPYRG